MRWLAKLPLLLLLCVLATIGHGVADAHFSPRPLLAAEAPPVPMELVYAGDTLRIRGISAILAAPDSTVKVGTIVLNLTGMLPGDTLHYWYSATNAAGTADTVLKHVRSLRARDSLFTPAPAYEKTRYYEGCVEIESGGRASGVRWPKSGPICWLWPYTRDQRVEPGFGIERLVIRPLPPAMGVDSGGTCATWQAAHPDSAPWRSAADVNRMPVTECWALDHRPLVWQLCAFAEDSAGTPLHSTQSARTPYCLQEFESWKSERSV